MKNITLTAVKKVKTYEDLRIFCEKVGLRLIADIGPRGGGIGVSGQQLAQKLGISENDLPRNYGAGCNYLGGGIRGAIFPSGYNKEVNRFTAQLLDELANACIRAYEDAENGLNDEEYPDGETNWNAVATKAARRAGQVSAY